MNQSTRQLATSNYQALHFTVLHSFFSACMPKLAYPPLKYQGKSHCGSWTQALFALEFYNEVSLSRDRMSSAHAFCIASERWLLLARVSQSLRLPNMVGYLQENTEWLQAYRFAGIYLSCSKVCIGITALPIFPIVSCCFFILWKLVHSTTFGNLHSLCGSNLRQQKKWLPIVDT